MTRRSTHLGDLEREIMEILWRCDCGTVRDVVGELRPKRRLAYTTVMTVMNRLVEKGLLVRAVRGSCYAYTPSTTRDGYMAQASRRLIDDLIHSYGAIAVATFLDRLDINDPSLIRRLQQRFRKPPA